MKRWESASAQVRLDDVKNVLARALEMLGCGGVAVEAADDNCYRPPLDRDAHIARFPAEVAVFPVARGNCTLYRMIAAQHAGRRQFGSLQFDHETFFATFPDPDLARWLFLVLDGARVDAALASCYRAVAADLAWISHMALSDPSLAAAGSVEHFAGVVAAVWPHCLAAVERWVATLRKSEAEVGDSVRATAAVYLVLHNGLGRRNGRVGNWVALGQRSHGGEEKAMAVGTSRLDLESSERTDVPDHGSAAPDRPVFEPAQGRLLPDLSDLSLEGLLELVRGAAKTDKKQQACPSHKGRGDLFIERVTFGPQAGQSLLGAELSPPCRAAATHEPVGSLGLEFFLYDEWDYELESHRRMWCRLWEIPLASQDESFFLATLERHSPLLNAVRRQFQQLKPEGYRTVKKLEEREDFDLGALVDARADRRAGKTPSPKLYVARRPSRRDVATLFLVDMSASTDEILAGRNGDGKRRVIDIIKEALVVVVTPFTGSPARGTTRWRHTSSRHSTSP